MAREYALSWKPDRQCWYKKYGGQKHYAPIKCTGKTTDAEGYIASLEWWKKKQAELKVSLAAQKVTAAREKEIDGLMRHPPQPRSRETAEKIVERFEAMAKDPSLSMGEVGAAVYRDRKRREAETVVTPADRQMKAMVTRFLNHKVQQAGTGLKSDGRVINIATYLRQFENFVGSDRPLSDINALTLFDYHGKAMTDMATGQLSSYGARDRMQIAKQFIRWAWEMGVLDLPRNIDSKDLTISVDQQEIKVFEFDKLKDILNAAPAPLKLYLLLMANCGMTAMDVSDLRHTEFNEKDGTITRIRSKRRKKMDAGGNSKKVKITWTLWPTTLELLLKHRTDGGERMLLGSSGGVLVYTKINKISHKGSDVDLIDKAYRKHCRDAKVADGDVKSLKCIRATSATRLGEHQEFSRYVQHFLAQSARSVADRHYVKPSQEQFDQCVLWLGKQYGFVKTIENPEHSAA
jgi:integrase